MIVHLDMEYTDDFNRDLQFEKADYSEEIRLMNKFNDEARNRGGQVFFSFPSFSKTLYDKHKKEIDFTISQIEENLSFPIITSHHDMLYSDEYLFDSPYHLRKEGVESRSTKIANGLAKKLVQPTIK